MRLAGRNAAPVRTGIDDFNHLRRVQRELSEADAYHRANRRAQQRRIQKPGFAQATGKEGLNSQKSSEPTYIFEYNPKTDKMFTIAPHPAPAMSLGSLRYRQALERLKRSTLSSPAASGGSGYSARKLGQYDPASDKYIAIDPATGKAEGVTYIPGNSPGAGGASYGQDGIASQGFWLG